MAKTSTDNTTPATVTPATDTPNTRNRREMDDTLKAVKSVLKENGDVVLPKKLGELSALARQLDKDKAFWVARAKSLMQRGKEAKAALEMFDKVEQAITNLE